MERGITRPLKKYPKYGPPNVEGEVAWWDLEKSPNCDPIARRRSFDPLRNKRKKNEEHRKQKWGAKRNKYINMGVIYLDIVYVRNARNYVNYCKQIY